MLWISVFQLLCHFLKMENSRKNKYVFNWSREAAENKCHNWWWHVKKLLCDLDLVHLLDDHANGIDFIPTINLALQNKVETDWLTQLNREQAKLGLGRNKLKSYRVFKWSFCCETYVLNVNKSQRVP